MHSCKHTCCQSKFWSQSQILKANLRTIAYYTSILKMKTVMYTNSIVCAVSKPKLCSPAANIIQKNGAHTLAKACTAPGFSSYSKIKLSSIHTYTNDKVIELLQTCQLAWFQCKSHGLMATQANLTGSPLYHVNIYKWHPNGVSDDDFVPQGTKMQPGVGNSHQICLPW